MPFFLIFLIIPLIEISLFVTVGDSLGIGVTLLLCVITALIGSIYVQQQGKAALESAKKAMDNSQFPIEEAFDGVCLAIAGITLITPGFFTDAVGFLLLIPIFRRLMRKILAKKLNFEFYRSVYSGGQHPNGPQAQNDDIIDVEYTHIEPEKNEITSNKTDKNSE